jgi:sodium-dependent dicarboxylate transporter 2/3/5
MTWTREDSIKAAAMTLTAAVFLWSAATSDIQGQILGVIFFALIAWSLYPERHLESSILVMVLLVFFQASLSIDEFIDSLFATYGGSGLWIIISGFVLAKALETSGLARRIALWITTSLGADPENIVLSVAVANIAVAPLSPSTTAKAFLLLPICTALVEAFPVEKGRSKYGAAVMLMAMAANNICSTAFLTGTVPNPISAGYLRDATGGVFDLAWVDWLIMALPLSLTLLAAAWLLCVRMFRPEVEKSEESLQRIEDLKSGLGPITRREKIVAVFFTAALALWITDGMHPYNAGLISLVLSLVLFLPQVKVMEPGRFAGEVPWGSIVLFAASMFLAKAVGTYQALDPVAEAFFGALNLSGLDSILFIAMLTVVSMFLHVAFTSTTVYATVMMPLVLSLGQLQGVDTLAVGLPLAFLAPIAVILPVNTIPNIVFYQSGYFSQRQIIKYGLLLSLISVVVVLTLGLTYWQYLGYVSLS